MKYFVTRVNLLLLTLLALAGLLFATSFVFPGEHISNLTGYQASEANLAFLQTEYATQRNLLIQFVAYLKQLMIGNWGISLADDTDIATQISVLFPATLELTLSALVFSLILAIPLGMLSALNYHGLLDNMVRIISLSGSSIPVFWLSMIAILIFSLLLGWLPLSGRISIIYDIPNVTGFIFIDIILSDITNKQAALASAFNHFVLPTASIAAITTANLIRLIRSSMMDVMETQYIKSVRARGISELQLIMKHAFRNAVTPIIPQMGFQISLLFTAAIVAETIFSWPGIGNWLIQAIFQRDYPAILSGVFAVAALLIILNVLFEVLHALVNPRPLRKSRGNQ